MNTRYFPRHERLQKSCKHQKDVLQVSESFQEQNIEHEQYPVCFYGILQPAGIEVSTCRVIRPVFLPEATHLLRLSDNG